jgi:DNA-binding response OmpR family regulator
LEQKRKIFVIDDDPLILTLVKTSLEQDSMEVSTFHYGEELLSHFNEHPDLIVLDYLFHSKDHEDVMDGKEIFKAIRELNNKIPVIMLSGQEDGNVVLELARMGIVDYVIKDDTFIQNLKEVIKEVFEPDNSHD